MDDQSPDEKPEENAPSGGMTFKGTVHAQGSQFAGRDINNYQPAGIPWQEVEKVFVPLFEAVRQAPAEKRPQAEAMAEDLKNEVAKGDPERDNRMAGLVEGLLKLVPEAASAIAGIFAQPILEGLAGPVTKFVLSRMGIS